MKLDQKKKDLLMLIYVISGISLFAGMTHTPILLVAIPVYLYLYLDDLDKDINED
jgi:hypothetical protein